MARLHLEIHPELLQLLVTTQDVGVFGEMSVKGPTKRHNIYEFYLDDKL